MTITRYPSREYEQKDHQHSSQRAYIPLKVLSPTQTPSFKSICTHISKAFGFPTEHLKSLLPNNNTLTLLDRILFFRPKDVEDQRSSEENELFRQQKMSAITHQKCTQEEANYLLTLERIRENTENELKLFPHLAITQIASQLMETLHNSNCLSFEDYFAKMDYLASQKVIAEQKYLCIPENVARRKQIDLNTWKESDSDAETLSIVTDYWDAFPNHAEAIPHNQLGEQLLKKLYTSIKSSTKEIFSHIYNDNSLRLSPHIVDREVHSCVNFLLDQFETDLTKLMGKADSITIRYFHFKSKKLAASLAHRKIRELLEFDYRFMLRNFKWDADHNRKVTHHKLIRNESTLKKLQYFQKNFDDEEVQNTIEHFKQLDELLGKISYSKGLESRICLEKRIAEIEAKIQSLTYKLATYSDDDFGMETYPVSPSAYPPILEKNKELPSEWQILALYKHMCSRMVLRSDSLAPQIIDITDNPDLVRIDDMPSQLLRMILQEDEERLALDRVNERKRKRRQEK